MKDPCLLHCLAKEYLVVRDFVDRFAFDLADILKDEMRLFKYTKERMNLEAVSQHLGSIFF